MAGEEKSYKFTMLIKDWRIYHQKQWRAVSNQDLLSGKLSQNYGKSPIYSRVN